MTPTDLNNPVPRPLPPDEISPKAVVLRLFRLKHVFQRNWKLLIVLPLLGATGGLIYNLTHVKNPTYTASILFNLGGGSSSGGLGGDLGGLASAFGLGQGAPDANIFSGDNFLIYATSRPVVEKTLMKTVKINGRDTLLVNYYIRHSGIRDKEWKESDSLRSFGFDRPKTPAQCTEQDLIVLSQIYGRIKAEIGVTQPERKSSFMELRCNMEDENLATAFAENHLNTIEDDYRKKQTKKTREMYDLLTARVDSIQRLLTGTENRLAQYVDQHQQVVVAQGQMMQTKLTRNSSFLTSLYYSALQSADNMRLSLIRESPLFTIITPVQRPLLRETQDPVGVQAGTALGLILALILVFFRETYRSVMREE